MKLHRTLSLVTLSAVSMLAACSSASGDANAHGADVGRTSSAVIKGKASDASQDSVVLLVHYDPSGGAFSVGQCTGTLLAPNLVLTARHCVAETDPYAACKADGTPIAAGKIRGNFDADTMFVFTGKERPDFGRGEIKPGGVGKKIFDDGGDNLCNHDIALILLEEPITDMPISPIRLDGPVEPGELITAVGWGVTDRTASPDERQQRKDIEVLSVGPSPTESRTQMPVAPNEFEVGESICSGDSGGPAFAQETMAVLGVVSRGGNATGQDENDPAASCIDGRNLYTKVEPFKDLILEAFAAAEAEPWLEGQPDPRLAKNKEACTADADCQSALCLADPAAEGALTCAENCAETDACSVEGEVCTAEGEAKVCRTPPPAESKSSCSTSSSTPSGGGPLGPPGTLVLAMIALASLRRRR